MTGLSNLEEKFNSFGRRAVRLLEDQLRESGAKCSEARLPLLSYVVVDRNLCTGRIPPSSGRLAERLVADVSAAARTRRRADGPLPHPDAGRKPRHGPDRQHP